MTDTRWMVLGASPSAAEHHLIPNVDHVAAAGDGILLVPCPDFYFINELYAIERRADECRKARSGGTTIYVAPHIEVTIKRRMRQYADIYDGVLPIKSTSYYKAARLWRPDFMVPMCGGGLALQWAVFRGATEIHMVGMEGYRGPGHVEYFTGSMGGPLAIDFAANIYFPFIQAVVAKTPDVRFIFYGDLAYDVSGPNVTTVN